MGERPVHQWPGHRLETVGARGRCDLSRRTTTIRAYSCLCVLINRCRGCCSPTALRRERLPPTGSRFSFSPALAPCLRRPRPTYCPATRLLASHVPRQSFSCVVHDMQPDYTVQYVSPSCADSPIGSADTRRLVSAVRPSGTEAPPRGPVVPVAAFWLNSNLPETQINRSIRQRHGYFHSWQDNMAVNCGFAPPYRASGRHDRRRFICEPSREAACAPAPSRVLAR